MRKIKIEPKVFKFEENLKSLPNDLNEVEIDWKSI